MKKLFQVVSVAGILVPMIVAAFLAITITEDSSDVSARIQAVVAASALVGTAFAAVFAVWQLRASAVTASHALATELPYLYINPEVEINAGEIVISARNRGRTVCTVSQSLIETVRILPDRDMWLRQWWGDLSMVTVGPEEMIIVGRVRPSPDAQFILGSVAYVNVYGAVQKSWFRYDRIGDGWAQRGGMYWNPMGFGEVRHHDDTQPMRRKGGSKIRGFQQLRQNIAESYDDAASPDAASSLHESSGHHPDRR